MSTPSPELVEAALEVASEHDVFEKSQVVQAMVILAAEVRRLRALLAEQKDELPEHSICPECKHEIDPDVCWCGDLMSQHHMAGHSPVPMGCECGRSKP